MKKLTIHIEELGPIRNADIELAQVMIFTGASNLGRSYTNFLAYYVFNLFSGNRLKEFIRTKLTNEAEEKNEFSFEFDTRELKLWMEKDVKNFFAYLLNYPDVPCKVHFDFEEKDTKFTIRISEKNRLIHFLDEFKPVSLSINGEKQSIIITRGGKVEAATRPIARFLGKSLLLIHIRHAFLLPPGRASLLNESFTNQQMISKTGMYDIFLTDFDLINNQRLRNLSEGIDATKGNIAQITRNLMEGTLSNDKNGLFITIDEQTKVPLSAAASSIKELSPLLLWTQIGGIGKDTMCIEEPEAHAHPEMQYSIADLLVACIMEGSFMQITTHSDYLLARLNQLIRLHDLKQHDPKGFEAVCKQYGYNKDLVLNKNLISAYYFYKDTQTQQIKIEKQNVSQGIPFATFSNAVQKQIDWDAVWEEQEDGDA